MRRLSLEQGAGTRYLISKPIAICVRNYSRRILPLWLGIGVALSVLAAIVEKNASASAADDAAAVIALDTEYQAAVKINDAATIDRLLADDYILVTGSGKVYTKADLVNEARGGHVVYEHQEDASQTARIWGDTAVITAKLWVKGTEDGKPFDKTVWFSDTYVRTKAGWKYVFGQSSLALPKTP